MAKHYCIFTANYLPNLGGVERYTYHLARTLIQEGNQVTVVTSNTFGLPMHERLDGINIYRLPCFNLLNGRFPVLKRNSTLKAIQLELQRESFDFVLIQTRFYIHSLFAAHFARKQHIPSIVLEHGTNHFTVNSPFLDICGHFYEHLVTALVKRECKHFYGVSQACCDWCKHFHIETEGILYNAVNLPQIQTMLQSPSKYMFRERYNLDDAIIISYTGRLVREKGLLKLITAVEGLRHRGGNIHLLVAGDGPLKKEIEQHSLPFVTLLGKLEFPEVVLLLKESTVFCLPTDYPEGFPTSVLEAAACRCYIVTTLNGGSKELILDKSFGAILAENSVEQIAAAIFDALQDAQMRESSVENTYRRLSNYFTWEKTTFAVMQIAERMTKNN